MIKNILFVCLFWIVILHAQYGPVGLFENHLDVGDNVKNAGLVIYDQQNQEYTISGSGVNIWFAEDQMHFLWKSIQGNFIVRARVKFIGDGVDPHRKIGWTVRNSLDTGSEMVNATLHGDGLTSLQYRTKKDSMTQQIVSSDSSGDIIQLERHGDDYYMSSASFGEPFTTVKLEGIKLRNEAFVGIYVCAHNPDVIEKAVFSNVRIIKPAEGDFTPYRDYLGSNMEVMDVRTGSRKILFSSAHSIQAPNWTADGKTMIYNSNGFLYRYNFASQIISQINTGFAINNNNDHVLSFDSKHIAISHHNIADDGASTIYILPIEGSDKPVQITPSGVGPSYLHGWSPDNEYIIYTASRNGQYDIHKIHIKDKKEIQLTNKKTLDDGSEYAANGDICFNSARTGTMKIWRMKDDGSAQTQLTFDEYNDWFPHVSPDGKWIVMLSYKPDVAADDHPFYKHVYLRLMAVGGGEPKIIAYVYGGQGTMNVPSWSPDSRQITFVSNTATVQ